MTNWEKLVERDTEIKFEEVVNLDFNPVVPEPDPIPPIGKTPVIVTGEAIRREIENQIYNE